ncbi:MAG: ATP-binding cassette domain-containing protein [Chloroflexota bacterium]|nr:ATP-binding cassette domain-containing protein [Chloroflexota bacterium]
MMTSIARAENIAYKYPQNDHGLPPLSLTIRPGEHVLIAGPSGCGKSTLARCLTGLIPHLYRGSLSGNVWLNGLCTADAALWQLAEQAGLVFQNPAAQMLAHSVVEEVVFGLENLGLPHSVIHERLEATLVRFGLEQFRNRTPQTLSGGEQQKLALAATTARQPPLLVLDEPLSMLDCTAAIELVAHLTDLARSGTAVVICEHREEFVSHVPELQTVRLGGTALRGATVPDFNFRPVETPAPRLEVSGLTVGFGGRPILRDLSFSAVGGQIVAVVGRNGVGKTTLLRALAGLQKHEGRATVNGERPDLGMVFQNADLQLFNATVRDEILYRVPAPDKDVYARLLGLLGLDGYEMVPPLLLSEGEKKRVALATVLMRRPRHGVLLDEPALGQDTAHKTVLMRLCRALAVTGQLVMFTTHDLPLALQADRLLLLGPEGFVADGSPAEIMGDDAAWASLGLLLPDWVRGAYQKIVEDKR